METDEGVELHVQPSLGQSQGRSLEHRGPEQEGSMRTCSTGTGPRATATQLSYHEQGTGAWVSLTPVSRAQDSPR